MKSIGLLLSVFLIVLFTTSCSDKVDFSNPKSVVEKSFYYWSTNDLESRYNLLADTCKRTFTFQDFSEYYNDAKEKDSDYKLFIENIKQMSFDPNHQLFRSFEIKYGKVNKINGDTTFFFNYETIYNENGKWKIIWTGTLLNAAIKLTNSQKYSEAIEGCNEILKYNPLDGDAYNYLGWCNYELGNNELALENAKKAINLNPKSEQSYNLLASVYSSLDNEELAIENFKRALEMASDESGKVQILSNMSVIYLELLNYNEAKNSLNLALAIDSTYTHALWRKAVIYEFENKIDSARIFYFKAIQGEPMGDYLQKQLYYDLANTEYNIGRNLQPNSEDRKEMLRSAKTHIVKALNFQYDNEAYKTLLNKINSLQ